MSKSYGNVIPLLENEKNLKKSIMKIVTNSLEPGVPKETENCTIYNLYKNFADKPDISAFETSYKEGISWGEAKEKLFQVINAELMPIRSKYLELEKDTDYINDLLSDGAKKARSLAKIKILEIKEVTGITKIT